VKKARKEKQKGKINLGSLFFYLFIFFYFICYFLA